MALKIIETGDGSTSIYNEELKETYHSRHGAIAEANHVFLKMGLEALLPNYSHIDILEIGFGTGLNAWLTSIRALKEKCTIDYCGIEAYPLSKEHFDSLNYKSFAKNAGEKDQLSLIQSCDWEITKVINDQFSLEKRKQFIVNIRDKETFDLIYFDAFGPNIQPDLWTLEIFQSMFKSLRPKGRLVTYSAKGDVRRAMLAAGFKVEKVPGPPGKREMLIAVKDENK
jgi:tRNA U34 5-methylaminomethyl-2-thiouridine-forming methyltransferase MnmC